MYLKDLLKDREKTGRDTELNRMFTMWDCSYGKWRLGGIDERLGEGDGWVGYLCSDSTYSF